MNYSRYSNHILWLFLIAFISYLAYRILLISSLQPDLGGVENAVVYFIQKSLADIPLYQDPELSPYAINQYGPLYYLLTTASGKLFGIDPDQVQSVFILNRSVSLVLNLLLAVVTCRICSRIFSLPVLLSLAIGVMTFIFLEITSFARPDSLNHLLYLLALYYFLLATKTNTLSNSILVCSALLAVAALFTKQSSFTLPVIVAAWMIIEKKTRVYWPWLVAYGFFFMLGLLLMHIHSGLPVIYQNLVKGVDNGINLGLFWANILKPFFTSFGLVWIPMAYLVFLQSKKETNTSIRFLGWAMILQLFISLVLSLKFGSHVNYFTEFWTLLFISTAFYWKELQKIFENHLRSFPTFLLAMILVLKILLISFPLYREWRFGNNDRKLLYEKEKRIADQVRSADPGQKVFNNLFSPHSFLNNLLFRQAILPQYEIVYFTTWERQVYDYNNFRSNFSDGEVRFIITKNKSLHPAFMDFTIKGYEAVSDMDGYRIFRSTGIEIK